MSGRELFVLIVGGVLALWGMLNWRIAWTGELPQSLQGGGGGWRRLAAGGGWAWLRPHRPAG